MKKRLNPYVYGVLAVAIFLGVLYGSRGAGVWHTSDQTTESGEQVTINVDDVDTVKGWMTFDDVSKAFKIPIAEIYAGLNIPAETPSSTQLKEIMKSIDKEVDDLRDWLKNRMAKAQ